MTTSTTTNPSQIGDDELIEAVLAAGRALVSVALRSLHELGADVTLAQHRALVELAARGPQRVADLADVLSVDRSAATRMCDRLVRKQLASRRRLSSDRRGVRVALTPKGRALVTAVGAQRRREVARVVRRLAPEDRGVVMYALAAFAAADDTPEPDRSSPRQGAAGSRRAGVTADRADGW
jgi:DNA-binding MarR family transcriptional regulator